MSDTAKMDRNLALEAVRVTEIAALSASRLMGRGDEKAADQAAVDAMRQALNGLTIDGTVVIGEGERDEAPMLYLGEHVGSENVGVRGHNSPITVDIAVDPLEGTNLCATGGSGAITVVAASEQGGLLHAPDCYMDKIVVGPAAKGAVDLEAPVKHNLKTHRAALAARGRRPGGGAAGSRHQKLIADIAKRARASA